MEKTSTRTPKKRAMMKWPNSWIRIIRPRPRTTAIIPVSTTSSPPGYFPEAASRRGRGVRDRMKRFYRKFRLLPGHRGARAVASNFFAGQAPGFPVGGNHVFNDPKRRAGHPFEHPLDDPANAGEIQPPLQKRRYGHFVRGIQGAWLSSARFQRLTGQLQARKPARGYLFEVQPPQPVDVQPQSIRCGALWIG